MATMTVDCGSFNRTSYGGVTQYGTLVNFSIPAGAVVSACSVSFTTHAAGGDTADRAFSLNGVRAHSGWASNGALTAGLLRAGNNTFRVTLKSQTPSGSGGTSCVWSISSITLTITYSVSGGSTPPPVGGGGPVVISPSSIDAGAGSITVTCPAEAGIWHMIDWTFGSKSGSWSHPWETGGTHALNIPLSWIEEIPNKTSGTLAIRVRRSTTPAMPYSYATDKTTNVTIKVPASIVPTVSDFTATLVANGVDEAIDGYVQGHSMVALAITATAGEYSSIAGYRITGGGLNEVVSSGTFGPFDLSGDITFTAEAIDARGRSASRQVAINILPYTSVSAGNVSAYRSDALKAPADEGLYATLRAKIIYSALDGQNVGTIEGRVYEKGSTPGVYTSIASDELALFGGSLDVEKSYTAEIKISDLITSHVYLIDIPTGTVGMGFTADLDGVSFGTYPEAGKTKSVWPIYSNGHKVLTEEDVVWEYESVSGFHSPLTHDSLKTIISGVGYDYTPCIQAAIAEAAVSGGRVILPPIRMITTGTIYVPEGVEIEGTSMPGLRSSADIGSIIDYRGAGAALQIAADDMTGVTCVSVSKIRINDVLGTGAAGVVIGTDLGGYATDIALDRIVVEGFATGFMFYRCYAIRANLCVARKSAIGFRIKGTGSDSVAYGSMTASVFTSCGGYGYVSGDPTGTFLTTAGWLIERNVIYTQFIGCYWDGAEQGFKISSASITNCTFDRCGVERFRDYGWYFSISSGNAEMRGCSAVKNSGADFASPINFVRFGGGILTMRNMTCGYSGDGSTYSLLVSTGAAHLDNVAYGTKSGTTKTYTIA